MQRRIACSCFLILGWVSSYSQWQQVRSIEGGHVEEVERVGSGVWAATYGGLYKSFDEGQTWVRDEGFQATWTVTDVTVIDEEIYLTVNKPTPFNADDWEIHLYRSKDAGVSWSSILVQTAGYFQKSFDVFRIDDRLFVLDDNMQMMRSDDDGESWTNVDYYQSKFGMPIAITHDNKSMLLVARNGVYLSQDLGETWDSLRTTYGEPRAMIDDSLIFLTGYFDMSVSRDLGQTWEQHGIPGGFFTSIQREGSGKLYALGSTVYVSENDGQSWAEVNSDYSAFPIDIVELMNGQVLMASYEGFYIVTNGILVESNSGFVSGNVQGVFQSPWGEMFTSTNVGTFRSADGGQNWNAWDLPAGTHSAQSMIWTDMDMAIGLIGSRLYRVTDHAYEYMKISSAAMDYIGPMAVNGDKIYAIEQVEDTLWVSDDLGATWKSKTSPAGFFLEAFTVIDQTLFILDIFQGIWRSLDDGDTWQQLDPMLLSVYPHLLQKVGNRILYTNGYQWRFSQTNGATWEFLNPQGLPVPMPYVDAMITIEDILFALIPAHGVYVSYDLGHHWESFNDGLGTLRGTTLSYSNGVLALGTEQGGVWLRNIEDVLDVPTIQHVQELVIHPVPCNGSFEVTLPESVHGMTHFNLFELNGRKVSCEALIATNGRIPAIQFDLPAGFYVASVTYGHEKFVGKVAITD